MEFSIAICDSFLPFFMISLVSVHPHTYIQIMLNVKGYFVSECVYVFVHIQYRDHRDTVL